MIRVLLFEDNKNYSEALEEALEDSEKIYFVKAFPNANKVMKNIIDHQPDVVLMDIEMPGLSGLDALKKIQQSDLNVKVLIQTKFKDDHSIFVALCRGAFGYSLKDDPIEKLEKAIVDVNNGGGYFSSEVAAKVVRFFQDKDIRADPEYISLTPREQEVLGFLVKGLKYKEIANEMYISYETVHSHIKNIFKKLHVTNKSKAILKAIETKLV